MGENIVYVIRLYAHFTFRAEVRLRQRLTENASMPGYGPTRLISVL